MNTDVSRTKWVCAIPLIVAATVATTVPARADEIDCKALAATLQRLEAQIRALDAKVSALEQPRTAGAATAATVTAPSVPAPAAVAPASAATTSEVAAQAAAQLRREDAAVRDGWRQIERGLSQDRVKQLLGAPQQTFNLSGKLVWYYYYPADGSGSVMFDPGGRVAGFQAPPSAGFRLY